MPSVKREIALSLAELEAELQHLAFWQDMPPSAEELSSTLPFCCDTLEFPQWLQFIFISKMRMLLQNNAALPTNCGIAPYAEEYFKQSGKNTDKLLDLLQTMDALLSTH